MKTFFFLFLIVAFSYSRSEACQCMANLDAQQAAQGKGAIVAQVRTLDLGADGIGKLEIQKVLKGQLADTEVQVQGQDGTNCNGRISQDSKPWIVIFSHDGHGYNTISCADTALAIDETSQKIQVKLGDSMELTASEFQDVIDFKVKPTVKSLNCWVTAERKVIPRTEAPDLEYSFWKESPADLKNPLSTMLKEDVSKSGKNLASIYAYISAIAIDPTTYILGATTTDPFFSVTIHSRTTIDIKKTYKGDLPSLSKFSALDGGPLDAKKPFLSYAMRTSCLLLTGAPLIPVN